MTMLAAVTLARLTVAWFVPAGIVTRPLRLNVAFPLTLSAIPFVLAARTPVPTSARPATPFPIPLLRP